MAQVPSRKSMLGKQHSSSFRSAPEYGFGTAERAQLTHNLNAGQRHAASRVLAARDYALVLGMPGTGKTTLVAAMTRALVARGQRVLLTAYTHNAVDALLLKLLDERVGQAAQWARGTAAARLPAPVVPVRR